MRTYRLSARARRNLIAILDYLDEQSLTASEKVEEAVLEGLRHIAQFPNSGSLRLDLAPFPKRLWVVHPYLVIYDSESDPVKIISITHGSRDITSGKPKSKT